MNIQSYFKKGETSLMLQGLTGQLEAILQCPEVIKNQNTLAILGHPHSLYGGTMQNKVVTTLARTFQDKGIPSLRMNFRGVGLSQGVYDGGVGESDDLLFLIQEFRKQSPDLQLYLAGFSFGSYVIYRTAVQVPTITKMLISIAPAVQHYDFTEFSQPDCPWIIIQGEDDDTAIPSAVYEWHSHLNPQPTLIKMPNTGHFFHSRLGELKDHLLNVL